MKCIFDCTYHHHRHRCHYNQYALHRYYAYWLIAVSAISLLMLLWLLHRWHYVNTCCDALIFSVFWTVVNSSELLFCLCLWIVFFSNQFLSYCFLFRRRSCFNLSLRLIDFDQQIDIHYTAFCPLKFIHNLFFLVFFFSSNPSVYDCVWRIQVSTDFAAPKSVNIQS